MKSTQRIQALVMRHLYVYVRSVPRLMDVFFWPVMDILILGFLSMYLNSINTGGGLNFLALLLGGSILWQMVDRSQNAVSTYFLEDVWYRNFINIFITPLTWTEFFLAGAILSVIRVCIVAVILTVISLILYHFSIFYFGAALPIYFINLFLFGFVLAVFISAIIIRFGSSAQVLAFGMAILVQPVSAVYYPVSALPVVFQHISHAIPVSYVFEAMRKVTNGGVLSTSDWLIPLGLNLFYLVIVSIFFVAMVKKIKIMGKLLKIQD
jgi:ABC-2 type transport system permease protein